MRLHWKPSISTSALHAVHAIATEQKLVDPRVAESLREVALDIQEMVRHFPLHARKEFWIELLSWSVEIEANRELAERVLTRLLGADSIKATHLNFLAGKITDAEAAYAILFPKLSEQLQLRARPLREFWDGFGSGLLAHIGRLSDKSLLVDQAEIVLLQPVLGGFGLCHEEHARVCIEALLTNALPELPEVIRLAWLLSQLRSDPQRLRATSRNHSLHEIAGLAMLPAVLAAGQVVELTKIDEPNLALAIEQWQIPVPPQVDVVPALMSWWETYLQTRPSWSVALTALDRKMRIKD